MDQAEKGQHTSGTTIARIFDSRAHGRKPQLLLHLTPTLHQHEFLLVKGGPREFQARWG